jgi:hypothetical protein
MTTHRRKARALAIAGTIMVTLLACDGAPAAARSKKYCSATSTAAFRACESDVRAEYWTAIGTCTNVSDTAAHAQCMNAARTTRKENDGDCHDQQDARRQVCAALGEARYEPDFTPAAFDDDFTHLTNPNPYAPLGIGSQWTFLSATESDTVEITAATKLIDGVRCIVSRDTVSVGGVVTEDTNDWFAEAKNGDVYYCGEETAEFETFAGDVPMTTELTGIEGSFKAGRDGDKPGIFFRRTPTVGEVYRQEFALGTAEDIAEVLSTTYAFGADPTLDALVPPALAQLVCAGDCIVTKETSPLDPGTIERKYYAPGIGVFLETDQDTGEVNRLVACNVDPRCASLPSP